MCYQHNMLFWAQLLISPKATLCLTPTIYMNIVYILSGNVWYPHQLIALVQTHKTLFDHFINISLGKGSERLIKTLTYDKPVFHMKIIRTGWWPNIKIYWSTFWDIPVDRYTGSNLLFGFYWYRVQIPINRAHYGFNWKLSHSWVLFIRAKPCLQILLNGPLIIFLAQERKTLSLFKCNQLCKILTVPPFLFYY